MEKQFKQHPKTICISVQWTCINYFVRMAGFNPPPPPLLKLDYTLYVKTPLIMAMILFDMRVRLAPDGKPEPDQLWLPVTPRNYGKISSGAGVLMWNTSHPGIRVFICEYHISFLSLYSVLTEGFYPTCVCVSL